MRKLVLYFMCFYSFSLNSQSCLEECVEELNTLSEYSVDMISEILINENCDIKMVMGEKKIIYIFNLADAHLNVGDVDRDPIIQVGIYCKSNNCILLHKKPIASMQIGFVSKESAQQFINIIQRILNCCQ